MGWIECTSQDPASHGQEHRPGPVATGANRTPSPGTHPEQESHGSGSRYRSPARRETWTAGMPWSTPLYPTTDPALTSAPAPTATSDR